MLSYRKIPVLEINCTEVNEKSVNILSRHSGRGYTKEVNLESRGSYPPSTKRELICS